MLPQNIGRYQIKAELGRGGMSTVYLAHDPHFERDVAIKLLPHELLHHRTFRRRFDREAKIVASLDHPAIVPVYDFGEQDDQPFLVMRFMAGGSLTDRLKQGPATIHEAVRVLRRLAPALDEVHRRGIVHRDLKPSNILFDQRNEPFISDFGTAKFTYEHTKLTETGGAVGTPAYMSPEQIQAEVEIDGRSDIYTLGVILFEMLTGKHPYQTNTPIGLAVKHIFEPVPSLQDIQPNVPAACQPVVAKVMAKQREDRYQTAVAFANDLAAVARHLEASSPYPVPSPKPPPPPGRRLALLIGNNTFSDDLLRQLIRPTADLPRLAKALKHPQIGQFDEVVCLVNEPSNDIRRSIARFFADKAPDDLLLLYIAGHAALDAGGHLHLAASDTEHELLRGTAVSALFIADEMDNCRAQQQILVLDCHFSRALLTTPKPPHALPGVIGKAIDTGASFSRHGHERVVLTASDATHYIWQDNGVSGQPAPSRFTEFFIQGLEQGIDNGHSPDQVTIGEIYDYVIAQLAANSASQSQLPRKWLNEEQSNFIIAHNVHAIIPAARSVPPYATIAPEKLANLASRSGSDRSAGSRPRWQWLAAFLFLGLVLFVGGNTASNGRTAFSSASDGLAIAPTSTPTAAPTRTQPPTHTHTPPPASPTSSATATAKPSATATDLPAPTDTAVQSTPALTALTLLPSSLFAAPDAGSTELAIIEVGDPLTVLGRSEQGNWLYVLDGRYNSGYIYGDRVAWEGSFGSLPVVPTGQTALSANAATRCTPGTCPPLSLDLYPVDGRCQGDVRYRTIYMQGQGGDGRYTYYWNGVKIAGPLTAGFGFEIDNHTGPRVTGTGKVVSGDGQIAEKPLVVSEFPCNP